MSWHVKHCNCIIFRFHLFEKNKTRIHCVQIHQRVAIYSIHISYSRYKFSVQEFGVIEDTGCIVTGNHLVVWEVGICWIMHSMTRLYIESPGARMSSYHKASTFIFGPIFEKIETGYILQTRVLRSVQHVSYIHLNIISMAIHVPVCISNIKISYVFTCLAWTILWRIKRSFRDKNCNFKAIPFLNRSNYFL